MQPDPEQSLLDLPQGKAYRLNRFSDKQVGAKLMTMGILPGHRVRLLRKTAFKGAFYIQMDHINIALRREEASCLIVEL